MRLIDADALMNAGIITMVAGFFICVLGLMIMFCAWMLDGVL